MGTNYINLILMSNFTLFPFSAVHALNEYLSFIDGHGAPRRFFATLPSAAGKTIRPGDIVFGLTPCGLFPIVLRKF